MGFLKRLFGGGEKKSSEYVDTRGIYFYVRCQNCSTIVRMRADKEYDLIRDGDGFTWHKTIVDSRCFRQIPTVVTMDNAYQIVNVEISGGEFVSESDYNSWLEAKNAPPVEEKNEDESMVEEEE